MDFKVIAVLLSMVQYGWLLETTNVSVPIERGQMKILGSRCRNDRECQQGVESSYCRGGQCICQPFYIQLNRTTCLQSVLLGYDCMLDQQCSLKVANSSCIEGACRCVDGFLQFRKHTCLGPARPGDVCYSNAHCTLWKENTHCEFLIPNLFGRCQCNPPFKQLGDTCIEERKVTIAPLTSVSQIIAEETSIRDNSIPKLPPPTQAIYTEETTTAITGVEQETVTNDYVSTTDNAVMETTLIISQRTTTMEPYSTPVIFTTTAIPDTTTTPESTTVPTRRMTTLSVTTEKFEVDEAIVSSTKSPVRTRVEHGSIAVSIGLPCVTDEQCRTADPNSQCSNGICDCTIITNNTNSCSAKNRHCHEGTFQCRSSGVCISWFFVCDGRQDCSDGSDEECDENRCPTESYRCRTSGKCISKANRCNGEVDCPGGEDESDCKAVERHSCPEHTFQCADGKCLPEYEFCNAIVSCADGSDEPPHLCKGIKTRRRTPEYCPFKCKNGRCRSSAVTCSGRDGCGDYSDENKCRVCRCPARSSSRNYG